MGWGLVCCDNCDMWFHPSCIDIYSAQYRPLDQNGEECKCYRCRTVNSSCCVHHSYEVDRRDRFSVPSCVTDASVFHNDIYPSRGATLWRSSPQNLHFPVSVNSPIHGPSDPCLVIIVALATSTTLIMNSPSLKKAKSTNSCFAYTIRQPNLQIWSFILTQLSYYLPKLNLITKSTTVSALNLSIRWFWEITKLHFQPDQEKSKHNFSTYGDSNLGDINWDDHTISTNSSVKGLCEKLLDMFHNFKETIPGKTDYTTYSLYWINAGVLVITHQQRNLIDI